MRACILAILPAIVASLVACGPPTFVESTDKIDNWLARGNYDHACVGLKMRDEHLRSHTVRKLAKYDNEPVVGACLCEAVYDAEAGTWDPVIAGELADSRFDEVAACLAKGVSDTRLKDRADLVAKLGNMLAPSAWEALEQAARHDADAEVRAAAVKALQPSPDHGAFLDLLLASDPDPSIRASAARAMQGRDDKARREALLKAIVDDEDASVRAMAIGIIASDEHVSVIETLCDAALDDPDASVRKAAVLAFSGTKSQRAGMCLVKRLKKQEDDGGVRQAILDATRTSPRKEVSDALCTEMGPWLKKYVKTDMADKIEGHGIVFAQNHNEWERSYECTRKAMATPGLSCYARNHLGHWFNQLGGKTRPPWCPGMPR